MHVEAAHYRARIADRQGIKSADFIFMISEDFPNLPIALGAHVEGRIWGASCPAQSKNGEELGRPNCRWDGDHC